MRFYTTQSLFKCLELNKTPQFKKWKYRTTFSLEVNAAVGLSGLVPLGFSLQQHPSDETPLQRQGGRRGDQQMPLSGCDKLAEPLPDLQLPLRHSQDRGNVAITECAALVSPTKQGKKCIKKNLKEYQKGKFQSRTIQVLLAPRCF